MSELAVNKLIGSDVDLQLKILAEKYLTETYGKVHWQASAGLKWLFGDDTGRRYCLDHPEYRTKDGKRTVVANLYDLKLEDLSFLVDLAKRKDLYLYIKTPSNYNIATVLVVLTERRPNQ